MASPNTFQIRADELDAWVARLAAWRGVKGVDAVLREMEEAARKTSPGAAATLTRHQLFSWSEALQGQVAKLPLAGGEAARALALDLKARLSGTAASPRAAVAPAPAPSAPAAAPPPAWAAPPTPAITYTSPPPITYLKPSVSSSEGTRFLDTRDVGAAVQGLIRGATQEILVLSPWKGGLDTMMADLLATSPAVALRVITRGPQPDEPAYHRGLADLRGRRADVVGSPYVHTRMLIVDGKTLILGAASVPGPSTPYAREAALQVTDSAAVNAARLHFATVQREARPES